MDFWNLFDCCWDLCCIRLQMCVSSANIYTGEQNIKTYSYLIQQLKVWVVVKCTHMHNTKHVNLVSIDTEGNFQNRAHFLFIWTMENRNRKATVIWNCKTNVAMTSGSWAFPLYFSQYTATHMLTHIYRTHTNRFLNTSEYMTRFVDCISTQFHHIAFTQYLFTYLIML